MHGVAGTLGITAFDGLDQLAVFGDRTPDAPRQHQLAPTQEAREAPQVARDAIQPAVCSERLQTAVKDVVGAVVGVDILRRGMALERLVQSAQFGHVGVARAQRHLDGAAALEQGHHREEGVGVGIGERHDTAAAARLQLDQAFGSQHLEGFAQRRAADLPAGGELDLVDQGTRRQLALEDHRAQALGDTVVHRGAAKRNQVSHRGIVIL